MEYLTVDASEADDHHALLLLKASDSAIRHCRIVNLNPAVFPEAKWVPADVVCTAVGHTRNLVIVDNEFRGTIPFSHWGGTMTGAWVAHNRFEGLPTQNSNFSMRGMRECVVEHNRVLNSGRAVVVAGEAVHNYFGYNRIENIRGIANGCEMFLYEMGDAVWHGRPSQVQADALVTADRQWDKKSLHDGAGDFQYTAYAVVTAGRGMGQCIPVASAEGSDRAPGLALDAAARCASRGRGRPRLHGEPARREPVQGRRGLLRSLWLRGPQYLGRRRVRGRLGRHGLVGHPRPPADVAQPDPRPAAQGPGGNSHPQRLLRRLAAASPRPSATRSAPARSITASVTPATSTVSESGCGGIRSTANHRATHGT